MSKFAIQARYSSGSWARMIKVTDDRVGAVSDLLESLGGSLDCMYFDVENGTALLLAELPDSVSVAAMITAMTRTGSFAGIEARELLSQDQLHDALILARSVGPAYRAPGSAAVDAEIPSFTVPRMPAVAGTNGPPASVQRP